MPKAIPMLEKDIQRQILDFLHYHKVFAWRNQTTGIFDTKRKVFRSNQTLKGAADIFAVLNNGRFVAIEVKRPGGKLSLDQINFLADINKRGGLAFMADNVEVVKRELNL